MRRSCPMCRQEIGHPQYHGDGCAIATISAGLMEALSELTTEQMTMVAEMLPEERRAVMSYAAWIDEEEESQ